LVEGKNKGFGYCWFYKIEEDKIMKMKENEKKCMKKNILLFFLISLQPRTTYIYNTYKKKNNLVKLLPISLGVVIKRKN